MSTPQSTNPTATWCGTNRQRERSSTSRVHAFGSWKSSRYLVEAPIFLNSTIGRFHMANAPLFAASALAMAQLIGPKSCRPRLTYSDIEGSAVGCEADLCYARRKGRLRAGSWPSHFRARSGNSRRSALTANVGEMTPTTFHQRGDLVPAIQLPIEPDRIERPFLDRRMGGWCAAGGAPRCHGRATANRPGLTRSGRRPASGLRPRLGAVAYHP